MTSQLEVVEQTGVPSENSLLTSKSIFHMPGFELGQC